MFHLQSNLIWRPVLSGHPLLSVQFSKPDFFAHTDPAFVTCIGRPPLLCRSGHSVAVPAVFVCLFLLFLPVLSGHPECDNYEIVTKLKWRYGVFCCELKVKQMEYCMRTILCRVYFHSVTHIIPLSYKHWTSLKVLIAWKSVDYLIVSLHGVFCMIRHKNWHKTTPTGRSIQDHQY